MGKKKGKKSGKSSGKKSGKSGKKKKTAEPQPTWKEALLAYQINNKERALEDVKYEIKALHDKNLRHRERNERLMEEQKLYMANLLKNAKEFEKKLEAEKVTEKEEVIAAMMQKWEAGRLEDINIAELKEAIARKEMEIVKEQKDLEYWQEYEEKGQHDHSKQIKLLEQELIDMQNSFDEMSGHLERTLNQAKDEVSKHTEDTLDKQKYIASEKAMAKMDKHARQEVLDNEWLQHEAQIHRKEVSQLLKACEELEKSNIDIMAELFECTVDDLKISRNFYLTQFGEEEENLDVTGILEMDLAKVSLIDRATDDPEGAQIIRVPTSRPKSATYAALEKKLLALSPRDKELYQEQEFSDYGDEEDDLDIEEDDPFNNYFQFDDEDFDNYMKLGPVELKLLNITGTKMPLYKPTTPSPDMLRAKESKPDEWPVTQPMIQRTLQNAK